MQYYIYISSGERWGWNQQSIKPRKHDQFSLTSSLVALRLGHTRRQITGTCGRDKSRRMHNAKSCRGDKILSPQHVAWIQDDLNSCDMLRWQKYVPATCRLACSPQGKCPRDLSPEDWTRKKMHRRWKWLWFKVLFLICSKELQSRLSINMIL